jgi:hypothetical protein
MYNSHLKKFFGMQSATPDNKPHIDSNNGNDEDMVAVMLPRKLLEQLAWLRDKSGAATATEALYQAIATEAYLLEELETKDTILVGRKRKLCTRTII